MSINSSTFSIVAGIFLVIGVGLIFIWALSFLRKQGKSSSSFQTALEKVQVIYANQKMEPLPEKLTTELIDGFKKINWHKSKKDLVLDDAETLLFNSPGKMDKFVELILASNSCQVNVRSTTMSITQMGLGPTNYLYLAGTNKRFVIYSSDRKKAQLSLPYRSLIGYEKSNYNGEPARLLWFSPDVGLAMFFWRGVGENYSFSRQLDNLFEAILKNNNVTSQSLLSDYETLNQIFHTPV